MKFSFLKEKITPDIPVAQVGFSTRDHKSEGVHDDPYASVVVMQANEPVIFIALDLCFGDLSFAYGIKEAIYKEYGLAQDKIIINYSHTHSVVAVTGEDAEKRSDRPYNMNAVNFSWGKDKNDVDYTESIRYYNIVKDKIMGMLEEGFRNPTEGDVYICKGESTFGVSRRYPSEEGILWKPYFNEACIDKDLFLLKFVDRNGKISGIIYNYACHPTAMGPNNYFISADFPGVVRRILEEENPGMTAVFLQGCGADIKPYISAENGKFKGCTFDELEQAGRRLASEIQHRIDKSEWRKIDARFKTGFSDVKLYTDVWNEKQWEEVLKDPKEPDYRKKSIEKLLLDLKENKVKNYLPTYMSFFRLDEQTCFICLENEVVSDIGKEIKRLFHEDIIVLGYSNSRTCYIPTKQIIKEGGYESESFKAARLSGPFVPEVEDIIVGRAALMVKS